VHQLPTKPIANESSLSNIPAVLRSIVQSFTWRHHLLAVSIFAAVITVTFHRAIFQGEVLAPLDLLTRELPWRDVLPQNVGIKNSTTADVLTIFYPWKHFVHDELRAGRFPLWCTRVGCGYPLAGDGVIKLFGLTTLSLWLAPPRVASILTFSAQLFIAMTGMYALLCSLRLRWGPAVFGALVYGMNSSMFQNLEFEHITGGLMLLPWLCWALWHAANDEGEYGWRFTGLSGLFFGLVIINGSVQSAAIVWVSAASFAVAAWRRCQRGRFWSRVPRILAVMTILGLAVGAIALLPNLELLAHNARARFNHIDWWQLTWKRPLALFPALAAMINPDVIGNTRTFDIVRVLGTLGYEATMPTMEDLRVYCGLVALVLAVLGCRVRGDAKFLGLVLIVVPIVVTAFTPLYLILYFRELSSVACGIAVLAALGLERLSEPDQQLWRDARRMAVAAAAGIVLALGVGAVVSSKRAALTEKVEKVGGNATSFYKADTAWQRQKARETVQNFTLGGHAVARFCALAALVTLGLVIRKQPVLLCTAAVVLNTVDLTEFACRMLPSVPSRFDYPLTPSLEFLQSQPGRFRVASSWNRASESPTARPNLLMLYGLDDPRVYESLVPANPLLKAEDWSALNVRYFAVPPRSAPPPGEWRLAWSGEVDIYENLGVLPRVYFTTALNSAKIDATPVEIVSYQSGAITVRADAPTAGWLVVGERYYPGWRAQLNNGPAEIVQARGLWQAVAVASGKNALVLRYRPSTVEWGGAISLVGLAVVAGFWVRKGS
jgi:hypothetical protein